jgi:hypothetical protein
MLFGRIMVVDAATNDWFLGINTSSLWSARAKLKGFEHCCILFFCKSDKRRISIKILIGRSTNLPRAMTFQM